MTDRIEVPVLVVGAGPVGMSASLLLARQGIRSLVVERQPGLGSAPAAHAVNARTLEILRAARMDMNAIGAACKDPRDAGFVRFMTTLLGEELGSLPYERQGDEVLAVTPTPLRNLSQHLLEPILLAQLGKEADVSVRFAYSWEASKQDETRVTSTVRDLSSDRTFEVRSRYVIAADGAGSRIRKSLGIEAVGPASLASFVMIHFEADLRGQVGDRPAVLYWTTLPGSTGTFVAHDIGSTWVYMHPFDPQQEPAESFTEPVCAEIVRRAMGIPRFDHPIRTIRPWHMTAQVAARFRDGRIFLVGDSAHRFPPTGGLGLNTGVQDAHNLAWKLGAVEAGWAAASLLDSYESERRPVAKTNADVSVRNAMRILEVYQALGLVGGVRPSEAEFLVSLDQPGRREAVAAAIANQAEHFDMLGLQMGFAYEEGAVIADGSARAAGHDPVRVFVPTGRPGSRLPHAWLEGEVGGRSTLDLVPLDRPVLVVGKEGGAWFEAARRQKPLSVLRVGADVPDQDGAWMSQLGIGPEGALLVRPDQHVAWRSVGGVADPEQALAAATKRLFG